MLAQFDLYKNLIIGGVIIAMVLSLWFYVSGLEDEILELKSEIKDSYIELANEKLQSTRYKSSLDTQNIQIKLLSSNEKMAISKLKEWKSKPKEVRYKTIYKIQGGASDECEDIKKQLDSVKSINYNSL